ncbi:SDR family oxidoreductase [Rhodomicrobium lacus]|uniref:NAD(P)-dependent oxidoreductase n=1 Tax=Rhodomicrobium lacus TaxID=2498452 RepID=UPI00315C7958
MNPASCDCVVTIWNPCYLQPCSTQSHRAYPLSMRTILIIGASRGIGLETVRRALDQGYRVRAFARSASQIPITHTELTKVNGDALRAEDVAAAVKGVDAVIETLGAKASLAMVTSHTRLFSDATRILIQSMESAGVKRLISVTGFGAGDSRQHMSLLQRLPFELLLGRVYADKAVQETIIRRSALSWVIVRPGILTSGPRTGRYKILDKPADWRNGMISRADVADFLVKQIEDDAYLCKTPALIG